MKPIGQKVSEGQERNDYWRSLTPREQLADLDRRLGPGVGAARQRQKLLTQIQAVNATAAEPKGKKTRGQ